MPALVWLLLGAALCLGELVTLDLLLLMLGGAALVTAGAALGTDALAVQVAVFTVTSGVLLGAVRPVARRHLEVAALPSGAARLQGRTAVVVEAVTASSGQVRLDGELWRARPWAGGLDLPVGATAVVAAVDGATLQVHPEHL